MRACRTAHLFVRAVSRHPTEFLHDWYLWANIAYVLAAAGYLAVDLSGRHSNASLAILALLYVASAILYWVSWKGAWPHPIPSAIAGEYINVIASLGFFCTALVYPFESGPPSVDAVYAGIVVTESVLALAFVIDALVYVWAWHVAVIPIAGRRGWTVRALTFL